jgi:hypothetical protein
VRLRQAVGRCLGCNDGRTAIEMGEISIDSMRTVEIQANDVNKMFWFEGRPFPVSAGSSCFVLSAG